MNMGQKTNNDAASEQVSLFFSSFSFSYSFVCVKYLSRDELTGEGVNCQTNPACQSSKKKSKQGGGTDIGLSCPVVVKLLCPVLPPCSRKLQSPQIQSQTVKHPFSYVSFGISKLPSFI